MTPELPRQEPIDTSQVEWTCHVDNCGAVIFGRIEEAAEHLTTHGLQPERWPDGVIVVDASDAPELLR